MGDPIAQTVDEGIEDAHPIVRHELCGAAAQSEDAPFSIGIWGDMPYAKADDAKYIPALIADMNAADLAYLGTRFLAANESLAVEDFKQMVVASDYGDIIATDAITGALANKLRPSLVQAGLDPDTLVSGRKFDLSKLDADTKKWRDLWSAGHGVGAVAAREPVAQIIASLNAQYRAASDR